MTETFQLIGIFIALTAAFIAFFQSLSAKKQTELIKHELEIAKRRKLFDSFDLASQVSISHPELLYSVHGLPVDCNEKEARSIAYLSLLLDGFQHFYREKNDNLASLRNECLNRSNFLNRILAVEANQRRWQIIKKLYYGEMDKRFLEMIEDIIKHENKNENIAQPAG